MKLKKVDLIMIITCIVCLVIILIGTIYLVKNKKNVDTNVEQTTEQEQHEVADSEVDEYVNLPESEMETVVLSEKLDEVEVEDPALDEVVSLLQYDETFIERTNMCNELLFADPKLVDTEQVGSVYKLTYQLDGTDGEFTVTYEDGAFKVSKLYNKLSKKYPVIQWMGATPTNKEDFYKFIAKKGYPNYYYTDYLGGNELCLYVNFEDPLAVLDLEEMSDGE